MEVLNVSRNQLTSLPVSTTHVLARFTHRPKRAPQSPHPVGKTVLDPTLYYGLATVLLLIVVHSVQAA